MANNEPESGNEYLLSLDKIGKSERDWMIWVLKTSQLEAKKMTGGDWENLRSEITAFCWVTKNTFPLSAFSDAGEHAGKIILPQRIEAENTMIFFRHVVEKVLACESVDLGKVSDNKLIWSKKEMKYKRSNFQFENWEDQLKEALAELILNRGHLVRRCKALLAHGRGEQCPNIFLALRRRQVYCSTPCLNRANTRATRERQKTASPKTINSSKNKPKK